VTRKESLDRRVGQRDSIDHRLEFIVEAPEDLRERQERECTVAEVEAVADDDKTTGGHSLVTQSEEQTGFADSGVTTEEGGGARCGVIDTELCSELPEQLIAADQRQQTLRSGHEVHCRAGD
jgi:hypothetical protein